MHQLVTIPMSHYCEKVRWALELLEVPYVERQHLQAFHFPVAKWHSGASFVPVLLTADGVISDSTRINRALDAGRGVLYPEGLEEEVLTWEEDFDEGLGVEGRRWIYLQVLDRPDPFLRYAAAEAPSWQLVCGRAVYPLMRRMLIRHLDITVGAMERGMPVIERSLAKVEGRLGDGARYLVGECFTAADLSFASLMAPLLLPERYGIPLPPPHTLGAEGEAAVAAWRARPAGQFALRLIADHRPVPPWQRATG